MTAKHFLRTAALLTASVFILLFIPAACATTGGNTERPAAGTSQISREADMSSLSGSWDGAITIQGQELAISVRFAAAETGGGLNGEIDIPQQAAYGLKLQNISFTDPGIRFELPAGPGLAVFDGTLENGRITGSFTQGGVSGTFALTPARTASEEPADTATETEVTIDAGAGKIYGTLRSPSGDGLHPIVLIIAGSGPTDRNGNSALIAGRNDSLKLIAETLSEHGIASLRYDKRGIGKSVWQGQREEDLTFDEYIADAQKWIMKLVQEGKFPSIGVLGHSEGAIVAMAATYNVDHEIKGDPYVSALVTVAGPGEPIGQTILRQLQGQPEALVEESRKIIESLQAGKTVQEVSQPLMPLFRPSVQPYLISLMKYDPAELAAKIDVPFMIVQGTSDLQVRVEDAEILAKASPLARLEIIDGMNHVLKDVGGNRQANIESYAKAGLPLDEEFKRVLIDFFTKRLE